MVCIICCPCVTLVHAVNITKSSVNREHFIGRKPVSVISLIARLKTVELGTEP